MATVLEQVEKINLFKLVINPESFAQSVENIFYLSFLIRDAKVAFEISEDDEPLVCTLFSLVNTTLSCLFFF